MSFSHASVVETSQLNKRLIRITLEVDDPGALDVKPAADSAVGVYFPGSEEGRNYSVRFQDGARIDLDVVLHARGPGTTWAAGTRTGDRVGLDHARSWYRPPTDTDWQLLVTDLSGLPATARIIEALPGDTPAVAIVEVADDDDLTYLPTRPNVTVITTVGTGNGHAASKLAELSRGLRLPAGRGYCWFAGEAAEIAGGPQVRPQPRLDHRPVRHHRLLAIRLRDLGPEVRRGVRRCAGGLREGPGRG